MPHQGRPTQFPLPFSYGVDADSPLVQASFPVFGVRLVRENLDGSSERREMDGPDEVAKVFAEHLQHADREHFVVMLLCTQNRLIGVNTVSVGTLNAALVSPREVFKAAILANAASVIVGHNHPSGDPQPSPEDVQVTEVLRRAGELLDIPVLDHVVVGDGGRYASLKRLGLMSSHA